jgi:hypothetical protein
LFSGGWARSIWPSAPSSASALIASGLDVLTISRPLGHGSPVVTLNTHAHLFEKTDTAAATAIEAAMRTGPERQSVLIARCGTNSGFQQ